LAGKARNNLATVSGKCQRFTATYTWVCDELEVPLAEDCSLREKAFCMEHQDTVLDSELNSVANWQKFRPQNTKVAS
jgi:hypothetical protein